MYTIYVLLYVIIYISKYIIPKVYLFFCTEFKSNLYSSADRQQILHRYFSSSRVGFGNILKKSINVKVNQ